jgi:hypothetical protein
MTKTFKQWMSDQYDTDTLNEIATHGCISGIASGLIYYTETTAIYEQYAEELHAAYGDYVSEVGEPVAYVVENMGEVSMFKNALVWFVAELYAQELTNV